jgi:phosphatidylglycerol:prolipoprotein diacylglycerol transferase
MHPILFRWGPFTLHTYGLFAALGFLAGYGLATTTARKRGFPPALVGDALVPLLLGGIFGARVFYGIFHWAEFAGQWVEFLKIWQGGLMWQGGFLGGILSLAIFVRKRKIPFLTLADVFAPAVALGQAVGRVGCLFAGCCYGRVCDLPWAITFHHPESLAPTGQALHPTQLYDAGLDLLITALLLTLSRTRWANPRGRLTALYLVLAGGARLAVEPFRADARGAGLGMFSATGLVAIGLVLAGASLLLVLSFRLKNNAGRHIKNSP